MFAVDDVLAYCEELYELGNLFDYTHEFKVFLDSEKDEKLASDVEDAQYVAVENADGEAVRRRNVGQDMELA